MKLGTANRKRRQRLIRDAKSPATRMAEAIARITAAFSTPPPFPERYISFREVAEAAKRGINPYMGDGLSFGTGRNRITLRNSG